MTRRYDFNKPPHNSLSAQEAEELFSKVDNSGHTNAKRAEKQRARRKKYGHGVAVDPLSTDDPSGSNVGKILTRVAATVIVFMIALTVFIMWYSNNALSNNTANLSNDVSVRSVADALSGGVEWGGGFTQFPQDFSVQEADENTGRIEVSVTDTTSDNALMCFSTSQMQASALSVAALLNPQIDTVIYHVYVRADEDGSLQHSSFFGFIQPTGDLTPFVTFIWTKNTTSDGQVRFNSLVTGVDAELEETLHKQVLKEPVESEASEVSEGSSSSSAHRH